MYQPSTAQRAHPPIFGASPKSFDDKAARSLQGVMDVFEIPTISRGTAVVVVADKFWTAKQARDRLAINWEHWMALALPTGSMRNTNSRI
ncbi:MAG: hypothetical protein WCA20_26490 [Candidatus Sulfotelmatobacter sp.]